jgi:cytosine/uracil/thiamine/allantoin permease
VSGDKQPLVLTAVLLLVLIAVFVLVFMFLAGHFGAEYGSYA